MPTGTTTAIGVRLIFRPSLWLARKNKGRSRRLRGLPIDSAPSGAKVRARANGSLNRCRNWRSRIVEGLGRLARRVVSSGHVAGRHQPEPLNHRERVVGHDEAVMLILKADKVAGSIVTKQLYRDAVDTVARRQRPAQAAGILRVGEGCAAADADRAEIEGVAIAEPGDGPREVVTLVQDQPLRGAVGELDVEVGGAVELERAVAADGRGAGPGRRRRVSRGRRHWPGCCRYCRRRSG